MSATRPCDNKKFYIYSDGTHTYTHMYIYIYSSWSRVGGICKFQKILTNLGKCSNIQYSSNFTSTIEIFHPNIHMFCSPCGLLSRRGLLRLHLPPLPGEDEGGLQATPRTHARADDKRVHEDRVSQHDTSAKAKGWWWVDGSSSSQQRWTTQ